MFSRLPILQIFRACCFSALLALAVTQEAASQTAPAPPTHFGMGKRTLVTAGSQGTQVWRVAWVDRSEDEDGFELSYQNGGTNAPVISWLKIPLAVSLTGAAITAGSTTVTCASTTDLGVGWSVTGTNIPTGATVESITSATTFVLSEVPTGPGIGLTLAAASPYKAAKDYTYVTNVTIPSALSGHVKWALVSYKNTVPVLTSSAIDQTWNPWPNYWYYAKVVPLPTPTALTVTTPAAGEFRVGYTDNCLFESYYELSYKRHNETTWSSLKIDFTSWIESDGLSITVDLTGNSADTSVNLAIGSTTMATNHGKLYLPGLESGASYDFRLRAVDFDGNTSEFTDIVEKSAL